MGAREQLYELHQGEIECNLNVWRAEMYAVTWIMSIIAIVLALYHFYIGQTVSAVAVSVLAVYIASDLTRFKRIWRHGYRSAIRDSMSIVRDDSDE